MNNNKENPLKNKFNSSEVKQALVENKTINFNKYIVFIIIAVLVGFGLGRITSNDSKITDNTEKVKVSQQEGTISNNQNTDNITWPSNPSDVLLVSDQAPGLWVEIDKINVPKSVWLAIHEDNGFGKPGNILGAQLFDPGMASGTVELLRGMDSGKTYYAMIHDDNGDRAFIPKMDVPIVNALGEPIMVIFKTTGETDSGGESPAL